MKEDFMRAIQITRSGGPGVLTAVDLPAPRPSRGELLIDVTAARVDYADTHLADGSCLARPQFPYVSSSEVAGRATGTLILRP
jgi:NADPH2:quinone reductase